MKKVKILDLKPTQFAVGMLEVDEKIKLVEGFDKKERKAYIEENLVPVVRGPDDNLYVVDKHHFLCVCYHRGIKKVRVEIVKDLSGTKMPYAKFWKWMLSNRSSYPYCQFGEGPRSEYYLPRDIRGLAGFEQAIVKAVKLAQSKEAKKLPGYGKLNLTQQAEAKYEAKKRARAAKVDA